MTTHQAPTYSDWAMPAELADYMRRPLPPQTLGRLAMQPQADHRRRGVGAVIVDQYSPDVPVELVRRLELFARVS